MEHDLVIRGGTIADGTGGDLRSGDIAVDGGLISAIGTVSGKGRVEIDATDRLVTPGFVDVHTHYDGQAIWAKELSPSSSHGVTTVLVGNCGVGFAPCRVADHDLLINVMEGVEDIPGVVMAKGLPWNWETFPEYLDALEAGEHDIDIAAYLPHSPLRVYAMGERGANREVATADELARMRAITKEAMAAGAIGFASSRLNIHRTADGGQIPSFEASIAELKAISGGMSDAGTGTLQVVLDTPFRPWIDEVSDLIKVAESCKRPTTFSLITNNSGPHNWLEGLEMVEAANARGGRITAQVLPRPVGLLSGLELSIHPFVLCESYRPIADLPLAERVAAMRDPALRARLLSETPDEGHPLAMLGRTWNWMFPLGDPPEYTPKREDCVAARAAAAGVTPGEWAYDYLLTKDGHAMFYGALANFPQGSVDAIETLLGHPDCILGLGDGGAHYGAICDASYPTFLLTHWVRDGERISVADSIRMLTRKPAEAVGLTDRGLLAVGMKADINVLDLDGMRLFSPHIEYDLPAGGRRLDQRAKGYDATIVSGTIIRRNDKTTGAYPGKLVRGAR